MDQNLGELPASCARMQKNCETNPITLFAINGLAFPAARRRALPAGALPREEIFAGLTGTAHENLAVTRPSTTRSCAVTYRPHGRLRRRGRRREPGPGRAMRRPDGSYGRGLGCGVCLPVPCLRWGDVAKTKRTQIMVKNQGVSVVGLASAAVTRRPPGRPGSRRARGRRRRGPRASRTRPGCG
jgi:hypothetical protein